MSTRFLRLLQLADSALPIGTLAQSFGLETLVAEEFLTVERLESFLRGACEEVGVLEGAFCRAAHRLGVPPPAAFPAREWLELNRRLSALKSARESRAASSTLGRRLLEIVRDMEGLPLIEAALQEAKSTVVDIHHCTAFGLTGACLEIEEEITVTACLHQWLTGLVSACQRLLPLGQTRASRLLWDLKPALVQAADRSLGCDPEDDKISCFALLLELGAMRHPSLHTRLFVS